jgi:triosephosphate isomerase (TIM)
MVRRSFIAGNWKMNKGLNESLELAKALNVAVGGVGGVDMLVCPVSVNLESVGKVLAGSNIKLGAQNMYCEDSGAYTGEVAPAMLKAVGCEYIIIGHSERRAYFGDTNELVNAKVKKAFMSDLNPIMCIGETLEERESDKTFAVIEKQVMEGLSGTEEYVNGDKKELVLAYEPVWAIGTGKVATPEQAQTVHSFIRGLLAKIYGSETAEKIRIQYGGSVKPDNIKDLISQKDIDGALVGGAALKVDSFAGIINNA